MRVSVKYILFFILFHSAVDKAQSQAYIPMLTDSIYWDVAYADMFTPICSEFGNPGSGPYRYSLDGDTVVNGITYKRFKSYSFFSLLTQPSPNCPPFAIDTLPVSQVNRFFMREDTVTRTVYRYDTFSGLEDLWYDFNAQVGDTMHYPISGDFIIDTIYNVQTLDGKIRKYFGCDPAVGGLCANYIEGLGGVAGPFHAPFSVFEFGPWLMCIIDISQASVYNQLGYCYQFVTGIPSLETNDRAISMFPNPVETKLYFKNLPASASVLIIDNFGKNVLRIADIQDDQISVLPLSSGLYFVLCKLGDSVYPVGKFVKR